MSVRSSVTTILKAAVCVAALWWVVRDVAVDEVISAWTGADPTLLLAAVGVFLLTPVLQGVRLRRMLAVQGMAIGTGESIRLAFAGNFVNFAVPFGSTTGDVYKAVYLARRTDKPWQASVTTFVDRGVGLATLLFTVSAIVLVSGSSSPLAPLRTWLALLAVGLAGAVAALRWLPLDRLSGPRFHRVPARAFLLRTARVTRKSLARPRTLALAVLDTLGIQIAAAASFLCAALALGFQLRPDDATSFYAFFSAGEMVKALPGPPQGLGTLEAAYGILFRHWATASQIVSAAMAIRAINLICALPGAIAAVGSAPIFRRRTDAAVSDVDGSLQWAATHRRSS